jgi:hypothetical protein
MIVSVLSYAKFTSIHCFCFAPTTPVGLNFISGHQHQSCCDLFALPIEKFANPGQPASWTTRRADCLTSGAIVGDYQPPGPIGGLLKQIRPAYARGCRRLPSLDVRGPGSPYCRSDYALPLTTATQQKVDPLFPLGLAEAPATILVDSAVVCMMLSLPR